jgi:hypothetical protein
MYCNVKTELPNLESKTDSNHHKRQGFQQNLRHAVNFSRKEGNYEENMAKNWSDFSGLGIHVYNSISHDS